jgi:predicted glycosyltransferase
MLLFLPFTNIVFTPTSFNADLGKKQIKINTYKELAYLHPHYFNPDPGVLDALGLIKGDVFFIVRFVSFDATHDVGKYGISNKLELINELQKYGRVFISSEGKLSDDLKEYDLKIEPEKFHSLLYYATLYVGEGGATAREAAFVGTHAVLINSMAKLSGLYSDLNSYGLLWFTDRTQDGLIISKKLLEDKNIWENGKAKLNKLISEKVDFNKFLVWFLENYPDSIIKMKADPGLQYTFK